MFLQQQFFFFDFDRGYVLFAIDYLSILVLFAAVMHYVGKKTKRKRREGASVTHRYIDMRT